jgi:hypothetical protein
VWRKQTVPRTVADTLALERGERILATATDVSDRWVVATDRALYLPTDGTTSHRIPWERVEHAEWDRDAEVLRVTETAPLGDQLPVFVVRFDPPDGRLLPLVRERISASVVVEQHVRLQGKQGVRVIARRPLGRAGDLVWAVAFDDDLDPQDQDTRAAAERALAAVRAEVEP